MVKKQHGGSRPGSGRKPNRYPSHALTISCTLEELARIKKLLNTRERATYLLEIVNLKGASK